MTDLTHPESELNNPKNVNMSDAQKAISKLDELSKTKEAYCTKEIASIVQSFSIALQSFDALKAQADNMEETLARLASPEAFVMSRVATDEEIYRMMFADRALGMYRQFRAVQAGESRFKASQGEKG